eukprot:8026450-Alexandrium_andersonii.AAC.1
MAKKSIPPPPPFQCPAGSWPSALSVPSVPSQSQSRRAAGLSRRHGPRIRRSALDGSATGGGRAKH